MDKRMYDYDFVTDLAGTDKKKNLLGFLAPFYPKSAMCWTVYMSMLASFGIAKLSYMGWLFPALLLFLILHLWALLKNVKQRVYIPFLLSFSGAMIILISRTFSPLTQWTVIIGMLLILSGSLLNSLAYSKLHAEDPCV